MGVDVWIAHCVRSGFSSVGMRSDEGRCTGLIHLAYVKK